jgi:hypothetical protein
MLKEKSVFCFVSPRFASPGRRLLRHLDADRHPRSPNS